MTSEVKVPTAVGGVDGGREVISDRWRLNNTPELKLPDSALILFLLLSLQFFIGNSCRFFKYVKVFYDLYTNLI